VAFPIEELFRDGGGQVARDLALAVNNSGVEN
jgi:hypothetical protein